jgi:putative glutamine amidotransferase
MKDVSIKMNRAYFDAVWGAGGLPVFLPFSGGKADARKYAGECDGFIFAGGVDIDPARYGEQITGEGVEVLPMRDEFELALAEILKDDPRPILGVCRGEQLLAVVYGGSLIQHLDGHRQSEGRDVYDREAKVFVGSLLYKLIGKENTRTNSFHHQAVKDVPDGFVVSAVAPDGIIEAIEPVGAVDSERFILGVQWHPELMYAHEESARAIFAAFVDSARKFVK